MKHLPRSVATIDHDIRASSVAASVRSQIDVCTLQLLRLSVTAQRDH